MILKGRHNQCGGCRTYFNSNGAFEKHRTGIFGKNRRCRTEDEMRKLGMQPNAHGFWVGSIMDTNFFKEKKCPT